MPCNETRGPLLTRRGRTLHLAGVMLYQRPFGPGIQMVSSATEPLWGGQMDGVKRDKAPSGPEYGWGHGVTEALWAWNMDGVKHHRAPAGLEYGWRHGIQAALRGGGRSWGVWFFKTGWI